MQSQAPLNVEEREQSDLKKKQQKLNWPFLALQLEEEAIGQEMWVPPEAGKDSPFLGLQKEHSPVTPFSDV